MLGSRGIRPLYPPSFTVLLGRNSHVDFYLGEIIAKGCGLASTQRHSARRFRRRHLKGPQRIPPLKGLPGNGIALGNSKTARLYRDYFLALFISDLLFRRLVTSKEKHDRS